MLHKNYKDSDTLRGLQINTFSIKEENEKWK